MFSLTTERLQLRSWQRDDLNRYAETCNTQEVMRWLGGIQTPAAVRADVRYFINACGVWRRVTAPQ